MKPHSYLGRLRDITAFAELIVVLSLLVTATSAHADTSEEAVKEISTKNAKTVVYIEAKFEGVPNEPNGVVLRHGTGFIVDTSGNVLTARHVVAPSFSFKTRTVTLRIGDRDNIVRTATVLDTTSAYDIALIRMQSGLADGNPVTVGDSYAVSTGTHLTSISFTLGDDGPVSPSLHTGDVSNTSSPNAMWETSVPMNPGDSGGPVFTNDNRVVAIMAGGVDSAQGVNFIVPIKFATTQLLATAAVLPNFANLPARDTSSERDLVLTADTTYESLPDTMRHGVSVDPQSASFEDELSRRGNLTLETASLVLKPDPTGIPRSLAVRTLFLRKGASIVTNGSDLRIYALKIVVDDGSIISFAPNASTAPVGGYPGANGGHVWLIGMREIPQLLAVSLFGQNGGAGNQGDPGPPGAPGARGSDGATGAFGCLRGGGDGAPGGHGEPGSEGGKGGDGGDGGVLTFVSVDPNQRKQINFLGRGGSGGLGGVGGAGGAAGPEAEGAAVTASVVADTPVHLVRQGLRERRERAGPTGNQGSSKLSNRLFERQHREHT